MNNGKIEQIGTPNEIYEHPKTAFVANFIGDTNLFEGKIADVDGSNIKVLTENGTTMIVKRQKNTPTGVSQKIVVSVRPEKVQLSLYQPNLPHNCFEGRLEKIMYLGTHVNYIVQLTQGEKIMVLQPNSFLSLPDKDTPIYAFWEESDCLALIDSQ